MPTKVGIRYCKYFLSDKPCFLENCEFYHHWAKPNEEYHHQDVKIIKGQNLELFMLQKNFAIYHLWENWNEVDMIQPIFGESLFMKIDDNFSTS